MTGNDGSAAPPARPTLGILGGGQLGMMLGHAAARLGVGVRFLDPAGPAAPAAVAGPVIEGEIDDARALDALVKDIALVTYESENVPMSTARFLVRRAAFHPSMAALEAAQDRAFEKEMFNRLGIATAPWAVVSTADDLEPAATRTGFPAILKTRRMGYDGKGQARVSDAAGLAAAWAAMAGEPCVLEGVVAFRRELSIIAVRGLGMTAPELMDDPEIDGPPVAFYPLVENTHRDGILRRSVAPAPGLHPATTAAAEAAARAVLEATDYTGTLAIEFFECEGTLAPAGTGPDGAPDSPVLVANEMAPRVHNSGHWSIEGAETSQFENHVRAVAGMALGPTAARGPCAMVNLIGGLPDPHAVLAVPGTHWHDYGKTPMPGRKLGHVTVTGATPEEVAGRVRAVEALLP